MGTSYGPPPDELEEHLHDLEIQHIHWQQYSENDQDVNYLDLELRITQIKFQIAVNNGEYKNDPELHIY